MVEICLLLTHVSSLTIITYCFVLNLSYRFDINFLENWYSVSDFVAREDMQFPRRSPFLLMDTFSHIQLLPYRLRRGRNERCQNNCQCSNRIYRDIECRGSRIARPRFL